MQSVRGPPQGLAQKGALCWPQQLCHISFLGTVILSAEALALRQAKQAQRRARQAAEQLSQEQRALIQTLLGAHRRHMSSMFHQFVLFRVRLPGLWQECGPKGAQDAGLREGPRGTHQSEDGTCPEPLR